MENMTSECQNLNEFYMNLPRATTPKTDFVKRIAFRCETDPQTVRLWIRGKSKPSKQEYIKILAEETGIKEENLFK